MSITPWLFQRQHVPGLFKIPGTCLDKVIDNFCCYNHDEYHTEGEMGMAVPPFTAKFSKGLLHGHLLGVADEDGNVQLMDTRKTKEQSVIKAWSAHSNAVFDIAWVGNEAKMLTASGDQTARLWDVQKAETLGIFRGHTCSLKSINIQRNSACVFATGARDGKIMVWDTRCYMKNGYYGPMNTIHSAHVRVDKNATHVVNSRKRKPRRLSMLSSDSKQSVTAVVFQDENIIISSGACDGSIKMWDIRKSYSCYKDTPISYHTIPYPDQSASRKHGYSSLILDSTSSRLFATCINDVIYMYQSSNLATQPHASFYGHQSSTFYIKSALSPDDRFLLSGSGDDNCYIFKVDEPNEAPWMLKGHVGEVTSVAWCPTDISKLVTCSDDNSFRIWRAKPEQDTTKSNQQIGTCERKDLPCSSPLRKIPSSCPTNRRLARSFKNLRMKENYIPSDKGSKSPSGRLLDDVSSCAWASNNSSPLHLNTRKQRNNEISTPTPRRSNQESPRSTSTTPKNSSRLILEEWLKTTPSPSMTDAASFSSLAKTPSPRRVLSEQNGPTKVPASASACRNTKQKIVLCVRPSSTDQRSKKRYGRRSAAIPCRKSSAKRKLEHDDNDKENPPSKSIKMAFASNRLSPKSANYDNIDNQYYNSDHSASRRLETDAAGNTEVKDILQHLDDSMEKNDDQSRGEANGHPPAS
eukprot:gene20456-22472_t